MKTRSNPLEKAIRDNRSTETGEFRGRLENSKTWSKPLERNYVEGFRTRRKPMERRISIEASGEKQRANRSKGTRVTGEIQNKEQTA